MKHAGLMMLLIAISVVAISCSPPATPEPDRVATRVAEDQAVAATLTAAAPKNSAPPPADQAPTATPTPEPGNPTATASPTATRVEAPPVVPAATPTLSPPAPLCRVVTAGLNLRSGPGTAYVPPLDALTEGTEMRPLSFVGQGFPDGPWIEVEVMSSGHRGWTSAKPKYLACNRDINTLPPGVPPPTPLPPSPTPTRIQPLTIAPPVLLPPMVQIVPVDGSDGNKRLGNDRGVNNGRNVLLPGFAADEITQPMRFRDKIVFAVEVFDRSVGTKDGAGIESVTFIIRDETGQTMHSRTEKTPGYCVFGDGEPTCTVWRFSQHKNTWPGGAVLRPGRHDVEIIIRPNTGQGVTWFWSFVIE